MASSHRDEISRLELLHAAHPDGLVFPHLADAYRRAGRYAQAESILDSGLRRHSNYSSAHVVLGRLRLDQGKKREAESAFQRVLQIDPQNQVALEYLADLCYQQGRLEESLGHYRRLTRLKTDEAIGNRVAELEGRLSDRPAGGAAAVTADGGGGYAPAASAGPGSDRPSNGKPEDPPDDDPPALIPEPGEVVTETMAELYARQGLLERAAAVYRELLRSRPGDTRLKAKLAALDIRDRNGADTRPAAAADRAGVGPTADARPEDEPWAQAPATAPPAEEPASATGSPPSIRSHLQALVGWSPGQRGATEPSAQPPRDPDAASEPEASTAPGAFSTPAPEPWADAAISPTGPSPRAEPAPVETSRAAEPAPPPEGREPNESRAGLDPIEPDDDPRQVEPAGQRDPAEPIEPARPPGPAGQGAAQSSSGEETPRGWATVTEADRFRASLSSTGTSAFDGASPQTRALIALTDLLVGLLEYRDPFFRGSSSLTRLLATSVAQEMGVPQEDQVDLALAAVLRDLGRLALGGKLVPASGTMKTSEARARIERHVDLALHLMEGIDLPENVRLAVRHHHERWDGAGYPDGLSGEHTPLLARILAVVDSFAAMVSPRPYRLPRKVPDAARELEKEVGTRYDPTVVDALLRVLDRRKQRHLGFVQRHHILIVNPDQSGATITAAKLCSAGYLAEVSVDVQTARERMRRVPVAALVVSAEEGGDSAGEFIQEIRRDPMFSAMPVVVTEAETVGLRVRLLEDGADVCFPPGISYAELHGTLGAMVRRNQRDHLSETVGGEGDDSPWLALQGDIRDFPLTWLLQVMKYDSRTAAIAIHGEDNGIIYLRQGDAIHARIGDGLRGEAALREMLSWRGGRFTVRPEERPEETSISTSIMHLLLTQAVDEDHKTAGIFGAVSAD